MKKMIKASYFYSEYIVTVNFAGYAGYDEEYEVTAESKEEAQEIAIDGARDDLNVDEVEKVDEGEYRVVVNFAGYVGLDETYTVMADDEDDARDFALNEAASDLLVTRVVEVRD